MTAKPKTETERRRIEQSLEKFEADLAALRSDGGPARCAGCLHDCRARLEGEIELTQARLRELTNSMEETK